MTRVDRPSARPFEITLHWLPREGGDPLESATAAEIGIRLPNGSNLTRIEDKIAQTVRETARLSAYRLAAWFAANWWRLRWEPAADTLDWRMSHHLAAAGGGFVWPDIVFDGDGEEFRIVARATSGAAHESILYLAGGRDVVDAAGFERAIDRFVGTTVARLCETGHAADDLVALWRDVLGERSDPDKAAFRRLEALAGFDADEGPEDLISGLLTLERTWGRIAIEEIAAASREQAVHHIRALVEQVPTLATPIVVPQASAISVRDKLMTGDEAPWNAGYRLAEFARQTYGLGAEPVADKTLARLFGLHGIEGAVPAGMPPIGAVFRTEPGVERIEIVLSAHRPKARRFEFARLVGGHLATRSGDMLIPATAAKTARQKFQRAFAAEFLCPIEGLREMFGGRPPDSDDVDDAATRYGVNSDLVKWMLYNRGIELTEAIDG